MPNENIVETRTAGTKITEYTVYPTGDPAIDPQGQTEDRKNVKYAIDNVADGGTVVLKRHRLDDAPVTVTAFNFGGDNPNMRIFITKSVTIRGDDNPTREWTDPQGWSAGVAENGGTTISGGRSLLVAGQNPATAALQQVSIRIMDIRFKNFYRSAIRIFATRDQNVIRGCSFVDYQVGQAGSPQGAFPFVVDSTGAALAGSPAPDMLAGNLTISQNFIGPPPAAPPSTGMNNLVHVSNCNLNLDFSNNRIEDMYFAGIAVYGNKGKTTISNNHITKNRTFVHEGAAIAVGARPKVQPDFPPEGNEITINGNMVEVASGNSAGILVFLLKGDYFQPPAMTPNAVRVFDNTVQMDGQDAQERAALACLGACSNSKWHDNVVKGSAWYGIWVSDHIPSFTRFPQGNPSDLHPTDNKFQDNDLTAFTANKSQVFIGATVDNLKLFRNRFGGVSSTSVNAHHPPLTDEIAEIRCKGRLGDIAENDFHNSAIRGWNTPPQWVGCIYLDPESQGNQVRYRDSQFPAVAVPPLTDEIFDAGTGNQIVRLGP